MSRKRLYGSEFYCSLLTNQIGQALYLVMQTSGREAKSQARGLLETWWWCHMAVRMSQGAVIATVNYVYRNHCARINDGIGAGMNILQTMVISASPDRWRLDFTVESTGIQYRPPLNACSWSNLPKWVYSFLSFSPSPPTPHPFISASSFHSSSTEYTNHCKDTNSLGVMKEL